MQPAKSDIPATTSEEGYQRSLAGRQVQMIAIGGAIGVGLFTGPARGSPRPGRRWYWGSPFGITAFSSPGQIADGFVDGAH
jgi:hypothetical protein